MKFGKFLKKALSAMLCAALIGGAGAAVVPGTVRSGIVANATGHSYASPTRLWAGTSYSSHLTESYTEDYYKFTLDSDSKVNFTFSHDAIETKKNVWQLTIYDADTNWMTCYRFQGNISSVTSGNIGLGKGTYYAVVTSDEMFSKNPYTIKLNAVSTQYWEKEMNDTEETANTISTNKTYNGSNNSENYDVDYYKFVLDSDSVVRINFEHSKIEDPEMFLSYTVWDIDDERYCWGELLARDTSSSSYSLGLKKGVYYLRVDLEDKFVYKDYKFTISSTAATNWEKELNDSYDTATKISTNKTYYGAIGENMDSDYYKFTLSSDSCVNIRFEHNRIDSTNGYWEYTLCDLDENSIYETRIVGNKTSMTSCEIGLGKGTYFILVREGNDCSHMDYKLTVNSVSSSGWEKEFNNSEEKATKMALNQEYKGAVAYEYDYDCYKLSVGSDKDLKLQFIHDRIDSAKEYWRVEIGDEKGNALYDFRFKGNQKSAVESIRLKKGFYYFYVYDDDVFSDKTYSVRIAENAYIDSVTLNKTQLSLGKGETYQLTGSAKLLGSTDKSVKWRTSDPKILKVDQTGKLTTVGTGTAWITASANGNTNVEKSCKVTVKNAPEKITLSKGILTLGVGEKFSVTSTVNSGAACSKRTYRTSNSAVVKMTRTDWQGDFVAVKPGIAYVTVRSYNGKEHACKVTVKPAPASVTISKKTLTLMPGQKATLTCSVPSDSGCATRTFRTSNSSIIYMTKTNWSGEFYAVRPGTAWVTVRTYNGKESSCKITVNEGEYYKW